MPAADPPETQEDTEGILLERIYRIENAVRTIDRLYESFLTLRFSPEWTKNEKPRLAAWLKKE
ncbi:MAG TPA: hypothetical protein PKO04_01335 [Smithellaceae bacterium]|nr:hypothetical protein [Smithellaceae bacterium]